MVVQSVPCYPDCSQQSAHYRESDEGDQSDLHIIIFDEIDAICKTRGSTRDGTGVHDSIVNQLLTKIDGVEALNNILLIGMTNRKDLVDEALLRPGRMEVQIEIGLPDEKGRFQILSIHSNKMKENSFLSADVDLKELASKTKNFSGAKLEGLVKSATSFALNKQVSAADLSREIVEDNIKVTMDDFMSALNEVKPAFGAAINTPKMCRLHCTLAGLLIQFGHYKLNGMLDCGERHAHIQRTVMTFVEQVSFKVREHLCSLASLKDLVADSAFSALSRAAQCFQCISMDTSENTEEFKNPASTHTPQNYTCSTLTSGGSRKTQAVSNKYRSG
ncbi:hypothetical protein CY35_07G055200 [Sphagnum magellanicum]|uniref:Uncharacterized protein n=1 Tax=Sphagnum magellanicum TaxID=128215 RepID=A0ACB8HKW5_9BRYO|nr:hypothetical protein CY35_07G055200 [Sphagnum magellanicum]